MKHNSKIICAALLALLLALPAVAGIRITKTGGGVAEMLALTALQQVPIFVKAALQSSTAFNLNKDEVSFLQTSINQKLFDVSKAELEFFVDASSNASSAVGSRANLTGEDLCRYDHAYPQKISISSRALYQSEGVSQAYNRILNIAFECWVKRPAMTAQLTSAKLNEEALRQLAEKLFYQYQVHHQMLEPGANTAKIHHFELYSNSGYVQSFLAAEFETATVDLTDKVVAALGCANNSSLLLSRLHLEKPYLLTQAEWLCQGNAYRGQLAARLPSEWSSETIADKLIFKLLSVEYVTLSGGSDFSGCDHKLQK